MTSKEIAPFFNDTRAFIQGNPDLREVESSWDAYLSEISLGRASTHGPFLRGGK